MLKKISRNDVDKIIIDLSEKEFASGLTYTAVTRVRRAAHVIQTFPQLYQVYVSTDTSCIKYMFFFRMAKIFQSKAFKERIAEEARKQHLCENRQN